MIPYGKQSISQQDIDAVVDVLKSDFLTQGPQVPLFEQVLCEFTKAKYCVAVNSATSALHIACLALGVGAGDIVWTSPITFVASANCALYCGASVDFVDIDIVTGNMSVTALEVKLKEALLTNTLPKVVIPVHLCGHSCDMQAISLLSKKYGFKIIEDSSHGIGGTYQGQKLGACEFSDISVFSFHPVKVVTTAEGGAATTNDNKILEAMQFYRSHGITKDSSNMLRPEEGEWYYEQHMLGFNYRMTELQAALGLSQMKRISEFVSCRNQLSSFYRNKLDELPLSTVDPLSSSYSAYHLQMIRLEVHKDRKKIFDAMRANGIQVHVHYFPVHLQPYYLNLGFKEHDFPYAEAFYQQILTLPLHPKLSVDEQMKVVNTLSSLLLNQS